MKKIFFLFIFLLATGTGRASAAAGSEFLRMDTSAAAAGTGGAHTACLSGPEGIGYNPAAINGMNRFGLVFNNISMAHDLSFRYLALGARLFGVPLALSAGMLRSADIAVYASDESYLGDISYSDLYAAFTAGSGLAGFSFGASVKYARRNIDVYSASSFLLDTGVIRRMRIAWPAFLSTQGAAELSLGLVLKNAGMSFRLDRENEGAPAELGLGASLGILDLKGFHADLRTDGCFLFPGSPGARLGLSLDYLKRIFLGSGVSLAGESALAAGLGIKTPFGRILTGDFHYTFRVTSLGQEHFIGAGFAY